MICCTVYKRNICWVELCLEIPLLRGLDWIVRQGRLLPYKVREAKMKEMPVPFSCQAGVPYKIVREPEP